MGLARILIQLDPDPQASTFDAVVAIDAGVDQLICRSAVQVEQVAGLIHGAIFTRAVADLRSTAVFIGGSNVQRGEALLHAVTATFFGPFRVSVLLDSNGANTTAAAAVLSIERHVPLGGCRVLVLGATGPVGLRVARLLLAQGARLWLASRQTERAEEACQRIRSQVQVVPQGASAVALSNEQCAALLGRGEIDVVVAAGAAGVRVLERQAWSGAAGRGLRLAIDLNAVPPSGIEGIEPGDKGTIRDGVVCYGALGVGALKMKIHRRAIASLFEANDRVLDAEGVFELGRQLLSGG